MRERGGMQEREEGSGKKSGASDTEKKRRVGEGS